MNDLPIQDLSLALFGCGRMGCIRADLINQLGGRIAFAYDVDRSAAEKFQASGRCSELLPTPDALDLSAIDALFVCTPPGSRGAVEVQAMRHGIGLFIEKPLAIDLRAAQLWAEAARVGNSVTSVGYMNRYRSSLERAKTIAQREGIVGLCAFWAGSEYRRTWWQDPNMSGGPINEQMTHLVDMLRAVGGDIHAVASVGAYPSVSPDNATDAAVALSFRGGFVGTITYSCRARHKGIGLTLLTPERTVKLEGWDFRDDETPNGEDPFLPETAAFLDAVAGSTSPRPRVDIAEAARTQRVVDAIKTALRSGQRVEL